MDVAMYIGSIAVATLGLSYLGARLLLPRWLKMDMLYLSKVLPALFLVIKRAIRKEAMADLLEQYATKTPDKVLVIFEDQQFTYKEINDKADTLARVFRQKLGMKCGDLCALMMVNSPDFLICYFALLKIGVTIPMINHNLRQKVLKHCLDVAGTDRLILGPDPSLIEAVEQLQDLNMEVHVFGEQAKIPSRFKRLNDLIDQVDVTEAIGPALRKEKSPKDPFVYIFTSGTTGLPKPAIISTLRNYMALNLLKYCSVTSSDIVHISLPLYHSMGLTGVNGVVAHGATVALTRRFSKSQYMAECRKYKVTVILYIGEMCRYLLSNPPSELDGQHVIRSALGLGMRQDIYTQFKERFKIPEILEMYAASEGTTGFININQVDGSVGRLSPVLKVVTGGWIYKWDVEKDCLVRDKDGLCVPQCPGEPGLFLVKITKMARFEGYAGQKEATEKKIVRNVAKHGDAFFNSGDLLVLDNDYNVFFSDRVGDTFRWKGENVATVEVSNALAELDFIIDACVYGVKIPGCEGRAGMATLLLTTDSRTSELNVKQIAEHCFEHLPRYAVPHFLRVESSDCLEMTSTVKQTKVNLQAEAFNPNVIREKLFYLDIGQKTYKVLSCEAYNDIESGKIMF